MKKDIQSIEDIIVFVDAFYDKVRHDEIIGDIFKKAIGENWEVHLMKMYRFWDSVLFNSKTYIGNPFIAHSKLNIEKEHFDVWLEHFKYVADEHFSGSNSDRMKLQAEHMAQMFLRKLNEYKHNHNRKPLI